MRWTIFWIVAIAAILWNLFGLYDFLETVSHNPDYMKKIPPDMLAWIQTLPTWRWAAWGVGVVASVAASLALLLRRAVAQPLFWVTVAVMVLVFAHDLLLDEGMRVMGAAFPVMLVVVEALFALYARWAAGQGMLKRP